MKTFGYQLKTFARANGAGKLFALSALLFIAAFATSSAAQKQFAADERFSILAPQASDFTNRQAASSVLGQPDFTTNSGGASASKFNGSDGVVVDPVSGKAFVVEESNSRILRFASMAKLTTGAAAEAVFGQINFTSSSTGLAANKFNIPRDISIDAGGRLWVADYGNNRVLRFDNAATKATGANADGVLGQTDFITRTAAAAQNKLNQPNGIFADAGGRVWVADLNNSRILRFDDAALKADGANADGVLGQPNFTTGNPFWSAIKMSNPYGVYADAGGRLWVADTGNNRILRFDAAATKANGAAADGVLGQSDFTSYGGGTSATKFNTPTGVTTDASGRLYVAEFNNNRVIIFDNAATLANGAPANVVLGQPDFTSNTANNGGVSAISMYVPYHLSFDETSGSLFVADYFNSRVLRFAAPVAPTAASVTVSGRVTARRRGVSRATVTMTGADGVPRRAATNAFGYYTFADVAAGETYVFEIRSKQFVFAPQVLNVTEEISNLNFSGN